jgi:homopolymeric O-antigen transport system permease protein
VTGTQVRPRTPSEQPELRANEGLPDRASHVTVIGPAVHWPRLDLIELWRFRELLSIFIWRDLKVRYKQTVIGAAWAIFQPAFTALVYTLIFGKFAKFPSGNLPYPIFAFSGVLAWQYFSAALNTASGSVVANVPLVTKVYFPRLLLPITGVLVPLIDLILASVVLIAMIAWFHTWPGPLVVLAPLFILLALVAALGAALTLSALNTRYRDVRYAIPAFMQVMPFLSGVPYSLDGAPEKWQWLLSLNPVTGVVAGWRWTVLNGPEPVLGQLAVSVGVSLLLFAGGLAYFRRSEPRFADTI